MRTSTSLKGTESRLPPDLTWNTAIQTHGERAVAVSSPEPRPQGAESPHVHGDVQHRNRHMHAATRPSSWRVFGMGHSAVQRGNVRGKGWGGRRRGWGGGCVWHQPGADIVPVAPLATPAPSVICVNICKPKVPLSPNVRAVCLAFPLRKPGVIHQNKTY